jgi:polysaccharide pyruvyl transferase WcaK-like protein/O-antigen/teichoic acid export membrane protein
MLIGTFTQLGLEYPLLKNVLANKDHMFSTALLLEIALIICFTPLLVLAIGGWYSEDLEEFTWLSVTMLFFYSTSFITRFVLLGIFKTKQVLIIDLIGAIVRFVVGFFLTFIGLGTIGIILAFLIQFIIMTSIAIAPIRRNLGFKIGNREQFTEILKTGLLNTPAKFSRTLIISLSVVMLASYGVDAAEVGIFYMVLMITIVVGGFVPSMAYMMIPSSSTSIKDLSAGSIRLALTLTAPIIAALIASPEYLLSLLGPAYVSGSGVLIMLSLSILPSSVVMLSISMYNTQGRSKELLIIGSCQVLVFICLFILLVPTYGIMGAAISMLSAFTISSLIALRQSDHSNVKYILVSGVAILVGSGSVYLLRNVIDLNPIILMIISVILSAFVLIKLKNTSIEEISGLVNLAIDPRGTKKIFVIGNYGNFNIGDEIILKEVIRRYSSDLDSNTPHFLIATRNPFFVDIYHKEIKNKIIPIPINHLYQLLVSFLKCSRVLIGGGGIWSKYTGRYAHVVPLIAILARLMLKRVDFVSFGIYSTSSPIDKLLVNTAVLVSNSSSVRDEESFSILWKASQKKTKVVEDLSLPYITSFDKDSIEDIPKIAEYESIIQHKLQGKFIVGISLKEVHSKESTSKIVDEFSNTLNTLNKDMNGSILFVFFPFAKTGSKTENDEWMIDQILHRVSTNENIVRISHGNPLSWFIAIDNLIDIFIGMRYHSIIFSSLAKKPILCIPYEKKIYQYLSDKKDLLDISILEPTQISSAHLTGFVKTKFEDKKTQQFEK